MIDFFENSNFFTNPTSQSLWHQQRGGEGDVLDLMNEFPSVILSSIAIKPSKSFPFRVSVDNLDRLGCQPLLCAVPIRSCRFPPDGRTRSDLRSTSHFHYQVRPPPPPLPLMAEVQSRKTYPCLIVHDHVSHVLFPVVPGYLVQRQIPRHTRY